MERRCVCASILVALMLCPVLVAYGATDGNGRPPRPLATIDIWVDAYSWHNWYYTECEEGARIYGSFEVTSGSDIDFYIFDHTNYNKWSTGGSSTAYDIAENVGSHSFSLYLPEGGTWHLVFRNDNFFYRKHIEGNVYYTVPAGTSALLPDTTGVILLGLAGVCLVMGACAYSDHIKRQKLRQAPSPPQSAPTYAKSVPAYVAAGYCPSCGAPRRSPQDKFCPSCGKPLTSGPELG